MKTVETFLKESASITGNKSDSCAALEELNLARNLLFGLDDWVGTIKYLCINVGSCFYLPWDIEIIRSAWQCNKKIDVGSSFYLEIGYNETCSLAGSSVPIMMTGDIDVFPVKMPRDSRLGFECTNRKDIGKEIFVSYYNQFGSLTTETVQLTEVGCIAWTNDVARKVLSLSKVRTEGLVNVKALSSGNTYALVSLYPQQIMSEFRRYTANGCLECCILVKAKKRCIPYASEDIGLPLDFTSSEALRFAIKAIQAEKSGDIQRYSANLAAARSHLEKEKEDINRTSSPQRTPIKQGNYPSTSLSYGGWD